MAFNSVAMILSGAISATSPAAAPAALADLTLDYDRIGAPIMGDTAPVALALAKTCSDPWWKMSGIQLATCMIAHPEETFGTDDQD